MKQDKLQTILEQVAAKQPAKGGRRIENVKAHKATYDNRYALCCEYEGARYHVWVTDPASGQLEGPSLYKNPPDTARTGRDPGYFKTRRLSAASKLGRWMVGEMFAVAVRESLFSKADDEVEAEKQRQAREAAEGRRRHRVQAAAEEMLAALRYIAETTPEGIALNPVPIRKRALAAIALTEGE